MLNKKIAALLTFASVLLLASCAKEGPTGPTGPAGPSYTGTIAGHVNLYDQYGSQVLTGLNKVQLALGSAVPINADVNGLYTYASVITGTYNITATDTGYAATLVSNVQFVSGTLYKDIKLSAIPTFSALSFITTKSGTNDSLALSFTADTRPRRCIVFVYNANTVSNAITNYLLAYQVGIPANLSNINLLVPAQDLYNAGFAPGAEVYYALYSYVVNDGSVYEDFASGKKVFNAVSNPVIDSALVP